MRVQTFIALAAASLVLVSCERGGGNKAPDGATEAPPPAPKAYRSAASEDVSGLYRPVKPVTVGDVSLTELFIGQPAAFAAWENGTGGSAPIILTLTSAQGEGRLGPGAYLVTDDTVRFSGVVGTTPVRFEAKMDLGALATARRNLGDQTVVLDGKLEIGDAKAPARLTWYGGD